MREQRSKHDSKGSVAEVSPAVDLDALIRSHVMGVLGKPPRYLRADVTPLYTDHGVGRYRVNVMVEKDGTSEMPLLASTITDSFFILADAIHGVIAVSPEVLRRY